MLDVNIDHKEAKNASFFHQLLMQMGSLTSVQGKVYLLVANKHSASFGS